MPPPNPTDVPPSYAMVNLADLDRMATAAAERAAVLFKRDALKPEDVEGMVEEGIQRFLDRVGIDDIPAFRKDLTAMRAARETREALVSHGLKAVVTVLLGGICTAVWLAIKGAK
ncbi:hypothetical protein ABE438_17325 [Bosea sp. TWI1241]|uniref:hypothetical protein n=1 Tax=Bosea sp. TWI1241 TaxID=3148904 RepID=UPI003208DF88